MLKQYTWRGATWQFEEGMQPADAVEVQEATAGKTVKKAAEKPNKAKAAPKNKAG